MSDEADLAGIFCTRVDIGRAVNSRSPFISVSSNTTC